MIKGRGGGGNGARDNCRVRGFWRGEGLGPRVELGFEEKTSWKPGDISGVCTCRTGFWDSGRVSV